MLYYCGGKQCPGHLSARETCTKKRKQRCEAAGCPGHQHPSQHCLNVNYQFPKNYCGQLDCRGHAFAGQRCSW